MKTKASALIAAGKRDLPPPDLEGAILGSLGVSAAVAPSLATKLWIALKHAAVSKVSIGVVALGAAASGGYVVGRVHERVASGTQTCAPEEPGCHERAARVAETPRAASVAIAAPAVKTEPSASASSAPVSIARSAPSASASAFTVDDPKPRDLGALGEELDAIRVARTDLLNGNATATLHDLDAYFAAHPHGALEEEALALRVRAHRAANDDAAAQRALAELERRFPNSLQLAALKK